MHLQVHRNHVTPRRNGGARDSELTGLVRRPVGGVEPRGARLEQDEDEGGPLEGAAERRETEGGEEVRAGEAKRRVGEVLRW